MQTGEGAGEEVQRQARGVHRPAAHPAQAHQEAQPQQAEAASLSHSPGRRQTVVLVPRIIETTAIEFAIFDLNFAIIKSWKINARFLILSASQWQSDSHLSTKII